MINELSMDKVRISLEKTLSNGVRLFLDGNEATPEAIAANCVREESDYMSDYVLDSRGVLMEIRFDRVSRW